MPLLEARALSKRYPGGVLALDGVSFALETGRTLGVVGESGSGKSTLARVVLRLLEPDAGQVLFEGRDITRASGRALAAFRRKAQIVFQDPFLSLDPRQRVRDILAEPLLVHRLAARPELRRRTEELLRRVELPPGLAGRFPRELSGGECQRVSIARAIATDPGVLVCDEAVSSLDAIVRVQILDLFLRLQREKNVSYVFISHDLEVVRHMSDDVLVLKDGVVCEIGPREAVLGAPTHPYTRELVAAAASKALV